MKRFWRDVAVVGEGPFGLALDGRAVKTPAKALFLVPSRGLAQAVAAEWDAQGDVIVPLSMPLTGLCNAAIDLVSGNAEAFADALSRFGEGELLAYRADGPATLLARQAAIWDPLLAWAQRQHGLDFRLVTGVLYQPQPAETLAMTVDKFRDFDEFRLVALNAIVTITGSVVIGLAMVDAAIDAAAAWEAGHLDELWQAEKWGRDPLAEAGHAQRQADLAAAERLLRLL